jgi:hypothetical protein
MKVKIFIGYCNTDLATEINKWIEESKCVINEIFQTQCGDGIAISIWYNVPKK